MLGGVTMTPYGFIKATGAYDSLNPTGDDFPRPAFSAADTGPNNNPEFHMKARATRIGSRFEWPDVSKNITITGQIEADFEGNFSASTTATSPPFAAMHFNCVWPTDASIGT